MTEYTQNLLTEEEYNTAVERGERNSSTSIANRMLEAGENVVYVIRYTNLSKEDV